MKKKKHTPQNQDRFMKIMGGRKMASEAIKTTNAINNFTPEQRAQFVSFWLPVIEDLEGAAEC